MNSCIKFINRTFYFLAFCIHIALLLLDITLVTSNQYMINLEFAHF